MTTDEIPAKPRHFASFEQGFAISFAEEISGETYFAALSETEPDPRRAALWRKIELIERQTALALRPLATRLGLVPADEKAIRRSGREEAADWQALPFLDLMSLIIRDYPAYMAEFDALHASAPPDARAATQLLLDHEAAMIDMARAELSGIGDPAAPLDNYLAHLAFWSGDQPAA